MNGCRLDVSSLFLLEIMGSLRLLASENLGSQKKSEQRVTTFYFLMPVQLSASSLLIESLEPTKRATGN